MFFPLYDENPTKLKPVLTVGLIALNLAIFLYIKFFVPELSILDCAMKYGMKPDEILAGERLHTLFTSMFLHGGWLHVIGNVWYLWIFGDNMEDHFGRWKFLLFYFIAGVSASMAHALANPASDTPTIGASGAIAGVLGAYLVKYPRARVYTLVFFILIAVVEIPAFAFLGGWIILQLLSGTLTMVAGTVGPTAYWAHIGGFVAGITLVAILGEKRRS